MTLNLWRKTKYRFLSFLVLVLFTGGLAILGETFLFLTGNHVYGTLYRMCMVVTALLVVVFSDLISREHVDDRKLAVIYVTGTAFAVLYLTWTAATNWVTGLDLGNVLFVVVELGWTGVYALILLITCTLIWYWTIKLFRHAPPNLRGRASVALAGGSLIGALPWVGLVSTFVQDIPASDLVLASSGILLIGVAFALEPKLAFVLPFRALRLAVVETKAGIPLFAHSWRSKEAMIDDDLFSGMLQGISSFVQESLGAGNLREIQLDQAVLLLHRGERNVTFVLVVTQTSKALREALRLFAAKFFAEFADKLDKPNKVSQFKPASKLVEECFPFVPEYE